MQKTLSGQIERITYTSEEDGFTIAKVKVRGHRDLVTVVGNIIAPAPGEIIDMQGEWSAHQVYGEQFKISSYQTKVPATVYGIRKYLGSGLVNGIGPKMASRIVKKFGEKTLDTIESETEKLSQVDGIGKKRIAMIKTAWDEQREIRNVMIFLQSHGVGSGYASKIFKQYGDHSIEVVTENPYKLATDIFGIGFVTADNIAEKLGFEKSSPFRIRAGIIYVLHRLSDEGHVYFPYEPLTEKSCEILQVEKELVRQGIADIATDKQVIIEDLNDDVENFHQNHKAVYLAKFHLCETRIAGRLKILLTAPVSPLSHLNADQVIQKLHQELHIRLAEQQETAIRSFLKKKVMVITGGPGTGKTTIINAVIKICRAERLKVLMAAPTGRAAKRMNEATGHEAKTIHRLLEFNMQQGGFQKNDEDPLECHVLIVDEVSMVDTILMHYLLKAVPPNAILVLVGDVHQLPSVGAGNVLSDIINSGVVPFVTLNEIFRQAKESRIIVNAHRINHGNFPKLEPYPPNNDFYFIEQNDPERVVDMILTMAKERIPKRYGLDPVNDIQVLSPMHKGLVGAGNLNIRLQEKLNPGRTEVTRGGTGFRLNDKVMQIRNNYDKNIYNGDVGRIRVINPEDREVIISFDGTDVSYTYADLDEVVLSYAVSIHKSQGSEYPAVIVPIMTQHFVLLQRNLIYTAVTRGKKLAILIGSKKALVMGIKNNKTKKRFTNLSARLK
ncbi:MAG: ATP-dependent RecD-like DNA helicase [Desulfobacterales bacterium]|nr:ATP-dependent RecD-like DNA helicase [Desulfobacterales bacterium]